MPTVGQKRQTPSARRRARRLTFWQAGADAFGQLGLDLPRYYLCPLCLHGFDEDSISSLSWEDVPPKSMGGKPLLLTCRTCNSVAGHEVDHHGQKAERFRAFTAREVDATLPARLSTEGLADVNVNVSWTDDGSMAVAGIKESNNPQTLRDFEAILNQRHLDGLGRDKCRAEFSRLQQIFPRSSMASVNPRPGRLAKTRACQATIVARRRSNMP